MSDYRKGLGWMFDIGFIDHLYTQLVTTSNYNAIANLHTLQITRTHAKPSQSAFTTLFVVTDFKNGYSSPSVLMSLLSGEYRKPEVNSKLCPVYNISARTNRNYSSSAVACLYVAGII
jgi:hypothetical protein